MQESEFLPCKDIPCPKQCKRYEGFLVWLTFTTDFFQKRLNFRHHSTQILTPIWKASNPCQGTRILKQPLLHLKSFKCYINHLSCSVCLPGTFHFSSVWMTLGSLSRFSQRHYHLAGHFSDISSGTSRQIVKFTQITSLKCLPFQTYQRHR